MARTITYLLLLVLLVSNVSALWGPKPKAAVVSPAPSRGSRVERYLNNVYAESDTNHDGKLSLDECYELVLRLYVQINQEAPIPPPSREKVQEFIRRADTNHNSKINRQEFSGLAKVLYGRAAVRLAAYKIVTLLGAPLTATVVADRIGKNKNLVEKLQNLVRKVIPFEKIADNLCTPTFGRTMLIVAFMATLGNFCMSIVNTTLDLYNLPEDDEKKKK